MGWEDVLPRGQGQGYHTMKGQIVKGCFQDFSVNKLPYLSYFVPFNFFVAPFTKSFLGDFMTFSSKRSPPPTFLNALTHLLSGRGCLQGRFWTLVEELEPIAGSRWSYRTSAPPGAIREDPSAAHRHHIQSWPASTPPLWPTKGAEEPLNPENA